MKPFLLLLTSRWTKLLGVLFIAICCTRLDAAYWNQNRTQTHRQGADLDGDGSLNDDIADTDIDGDGRPNDDLAETDDDGDGVAVVRDDDDNNNLVKDIDEASHHPEIGEEEL